MTLLLLEQILQCSSVCKVLIDNARAPKPNLMFSIENDLNNNMISKGNPSPENCPSSKILIYIINRSQVT